MKHLTAIAIATLAASALANHDTSAFEKLKALSGTWKGTARAEGGQMVTSVTYRVTSGGSTVEETIAPGTPHEMVTMYYLDGKTLVLNHYCDSGNQPHMKLMEGSQPDELKFDFAGGSNIKPDGMHMHSVDFKFLGADHIETEWMGMMGGKPMVHVKMDLTRVGAGAK